VYGFEFEIGSGAALERVTSGSDDRPRLDAAAVDHSPLGIELLSAAAGSERRNVDAVGTADAAVATRPILGKIDDDALAVACAAHSQSAELLLPNHIDKGHPRLDYHAFDQRRLRRCGVQVVFLPVVPDKLRQCVCFLQHRVDLIDDSFFVELP